MKTNKRYTVLLNHAESGCINDPVFDSDSITEVQNYINKSFEHSDGSDGYELVDNIAEKSIKFWDEKEMKSLRLDSIRSVIDRCKFCGLHKYRQNTVFGSGNPDAELMFIGEAPGYFEDKKGIPFVGSSGKLLDDAIEECLGCERHKFYITNIVKCRPLDNRNPNAIEIGACMPYLKKQIDIIRPNIIVTLGKIASQILLDTGKPMKEMRGKRFEYRLKDRVCTVIPVYHPSYILRNFETIDKWKIDFKKISYLIKGKK